MIDEKPPAPTWAEIVASVAEDQAASEKTRKRDAIIQGRMGSVQDPGGADGKENDVARLVRGEAGKQAVSGTVSELWTSERAAEDV